MFLLFVAVAVGSLVLSHTAPFPFAFDEAAGTRALWEVPPQPGGPHVYLTFDDGPNPAVTPAVLDVLRAERVPATFFLIDRWVTAGTAPIIRRMFAEGHGVALHSDTPRLTMLPPDRLAGTLTRAADRIEALTGSRPCRAFRPHAGFRSAAMYAGLGRIDHVLVGWGWRLWDFSWFRRRTADEIVPRLVGRASDGDIVVIHDGHHKDRGADRQYAVETVRRLVPELRARGFRFGNVCDEVARRVEAFDKSEIRSRNSEVGVSRRSATFDF
ncbi:MAG TPA: polysaccharide deacetylase family protein [Vicinamibacterales bacterium]